MTGGNAMKKDAVFWSLIIAVPLIVGLAVYLIFKPSAFVSKWLYDLFGWRQPWVHTPLSPFWIFIRFYLCDLLWALSLTAVSQLILGTGRKQVIVSFLICVLTGTAVELLQHHGIIPGTFDIWDLIVESIGSVLSIIITTTHTRRKRSEKKIS